MKIGKIDIDKAVVLAPMEGITDLPFRIICRRMGADIVYSEFIASEALIRDSEKSFKKMTIVPYERPVSIQIFGSKIESMVESAKIVEDGGADILDINYGCWVKRVVNHNAGAALLKDPETMAEMTRAVAEAVDIPVTIKTRLGWDHSTIQIEKVAKMQEEAGAQAFALHCRTRDMAMKGEADWSWIPKVKTAIDIPVILNGDVKTPEDAKRAFDTTGCDAVMIGRAAVGNPFLFKRVKQYLTTGIIPGEPDVGERIELCLEHLQLTIIYKSYPRGLYEFRKHYSGYLKGLYDSSRIRQQLVITESFDEVKKILWEYRDFLAGREDAIVTPRDQTHSNLSCPAE